MDLKGYFYGLKAKNLASSPNGEINFLNAIEHKTLGVECTMQLLGAWGTLQSGTPGTTHKVQPPRSLSSESSQSPLFCK